MGTGPDVYREGPYSLVDRALVRLGLLSSLPVVRRRRNGTIILPTGKTPPGGAASRPDRQKIQRRR